jgi:tripartite-type tricarboxylate transporter receptor subunit TctC
MTPWTALYAPRGTPKEIVDKLNAEIMKVLAEKESREKLMSLGFEPAGGTPDQLAAFEKTEREKWGALIKAAGLKGD